MQTTSITHRSRPEAADTAALSYGLALVGMAGVTGSAPALAGRLLP